MIDERTYPGPDTDTFIKLEVLELDGRRWLVVRIDGEDFEDTFNLEESVAVARFLKEMFLSGGTDERRDR